MEIFPPDSLAGVGMGDIATIVALGGLIGVAVTTGMLLVEGVFGLVVFLVAALLVLSEREGLLADRQEVLLPLLGLIVLLGVARMALGRRPGIDDGPRAGAPAEAQASRRASERLSRPQVEAATAPPPRTPTGPSAPPRAVRVIDALLIALGGGTLGWVWTQWDERSFGFGAEAAAGIAIGVVGAAVGAIAAWLFLRGAVRAGGDRTIVGIAVVLIALVLKGGAFFVPFLGFLVLLATGFAAVRLRRAASRKYKGLRILS